MTTTAPPSRSGGPTTADPSRPADMPTTNAELYWRVAVPAPPVPHHLVGQDDEVLGLLTPVDDDPPELVMVDAPSHRSQGFGRLAALCRSARFISWTRVPSDTGGWPGIGRLSASQRIENPSLPWNHQDRCADRRSPRSRRTVGTKVIGSLSAKLCAHFKPGLDHRWRSHDRDPIQLSDRPPGRETCQQVGGSPGRRLCRGAVGLGSSGGAGW